MDKLNIAATKSSPSVQYFPEENILELTGYSFPRNASQFYKPVIQWLEDNLPRITGTLTLKFRLIFLNTSSSKFILSIIRLLEGGGTQGLTIKVEWYHHQDNEIACDCGEFFKSATSLSFDIIEMGD